MHERGGDLEGDLDRKGRLTGCESEVEEGGEEKEEDEDDGGGALLG